MLTIEGTEYGVPRGKGEVVKAAIGKARFESHDPFCPPKHDRYLESISTIEAAWLATWLDEDERLFAWLETATEVTLTSSLLAEPPTIAWRFLLTDLRAALVAISSIGDFKIQPLEGAIEVSASLTRRVMTWRELSWESTLTNGKRHDRLSALVPRSRPLRIVAMAARMFAVSKRRDEDEQAALELIAGPLRDNHPLARMTQGPPGKS